MAAIRRAGPRRTAPAFRWAMGIAAALLLVALAMPFRRDPRAAKPAAAESDMAFASAADRDDDALLRDAEYLAQGGDDHADLAPRGKPVTRRPYLFAATAVLLSSTPRRCSRRGRRKGSGGSARGSRRQLDLSADQVAQLEKIFARSKPKLIDLRADFEKKQFDYDQAMQSDDVDRKAIEAKIEAREQARAALQKELALMELDMKKVLNPEQREKLVRMREKARVMVQERRRHMRDSALDGDETDGPPADRRKQVVTPKPNR